MQQESQSRKAAAPSSVVQQQIPQQSDSTEKANNLWGFAAKQLKDGVAKKVGK